MPNELIDTIRAETGLRLILPLGLGLQIGDVISVDRNGLFKLEGDSKSLLGMRVGTIRPPDGAEDIERQYGEGTEIRFRAKGDASTLPIPGISTATAAIDLSFKVEGGWVLALVQRTIYSLEGLDAYREAILDAYSRNVWKTDWALVDSIVKVEKMTLLASDSANTNVALSLGADVDAAASLGAKLTADVSIHALNRDLFKCISNRPRTAFCTALRVHKKWFKTTVGSLRGTDSLESESFIDAEHASFWESVDAGAGRA